MTQIPRLRYSNALKTRKRAKERSGYDRVLRQVVDVTDEQELLGRFQRAAEVGTVTWLRARKRGMPCSRQLTQAGSVDLVDHDTRRLPR